MTRADDGEIVSHFTWVENLRLVNGVIATDFQAAIKQGLQAFYTQEIACANDKDAIACFVGGVD